MTWIHDDISEKIRTQDHMQFCACVYCIEIGIVFILSRFGEEAGTLVKLCWLGVIKFVDFNGEIITYTVKAHVHICS